MKTDKVLKELSLLDSSLLDIDSIATDAQYNERLIMLLQDILKRQFPTNTGKQQIHPHKDRITFSCPYCGDSMKSDYKKRGNFILSGKFANHFKCHNCDEFKRIDNFFKDFKIDLDLNIINYISAGIKDFSNYNVNYKYDISIFMDNNIDEYALVRQEFSKYFGLSEVKDSPVWPWLKSRLQYDTSKFLYNKFHNYLVILNLTPSGKILGVQKRNFKGQNKYLTYKLSRLYELMKKDAKIIPDKIDDISQLFNICLVNFSKEVTLFEGPLDSFLYKNSIANTGANKALIMDIPLLQYFFDDDKTGKNKSIENINKGEKVFLWDKIKRDYQLPNRSKWDLNDLLIYLKENNINIPNFANYFSGDSFDLIDI